MNPVEASVSQITAPPAEGRRERKKQRTRDALIEAAMELFEAKGYERTAVHEITDAVDVSERTFFRYFASKEDLALSFVRDGAAAFAAALAARPAAEEPLTAARAAFHISLRQLAGSLPSYLSVIRLIETTPALLAAHLRYVHEHDDEIIQVLAEREGVDRLAGVPGQPGPAGRGRPGAGGDRRHLRQLRRRGPPRPQRALDLTLSRAR
jgi:AcrR family transcriptional regulator